MTFSEILKFPLFCACVFSFHLFLFVLHHFYWRYYNSRTKINIQYRNMIYRMSLTSGQSHAACHAKPSSINICARLKWIRSENVTKNSITNKHSFFRCWLPLNNTQRQRHFIWLEWHGIGTPELDKSGVEFLGFVFLSQMWCSLMAADGISISLWWIDFSLDV